MIYRHQVFGELLDQYPQYSSRVKGWRQSSFHYQAAANFNNIRKKGFSNTKKEFSANPAVVALVENTQLTPYRPARVIYKFQRFVGKAVVRAVLMQLGKDVSAVFSYHYYFRQSKTPSPKKLKLNINLICSILGKGNYQRFRIPDLGCARAKNRSHRGDCDVAIKSFR